MVAGHHITTLFVNMTLLLTLTSTEVFYCTLFCMQDVSQDWQLCVPSSYNWRSVFKKVIKILKYSLNSVTSIVKQCDSYIKSRLLKTSWYNCPFIQTGRYVYITQIIGNTVKLKSWDMHRSSYAFVSLLATINKLFKICFYWAPVVFINSIWITITQFWLYLNFINY